MPEAMGFSASSRPYERIEIRANGSCIRRVLSDETLNASVNVAESANQNHENVIVSRVYQKHLA
jgi:hypothetical protein